MNYKTVTKIITVLLIIATILGAVNMVFASDIEIPSGNPGGYSGSGLDTTAERIIGIVQFICYAAAVILLVILGVKWIAAAPNEKEKKKKQAAVLVFAAGAILQVIRSVASKTVQAGQ